MEQDDDHASFLPDWTLPELPKPTSLSTTRLEDIFDTNIHPLIGLQDDLGALSGNHDDSSGPLISSIEESLEMKLPGGGLESDETAAVIDSTDKTTNEKQQDSSSITKTQEHTTPVTSSLETPPIDKEEDKTKIEKQAIDQEESNPSVVVQEETIDTTVKEEEEEEMEEREEEETVKEKTIRRSGRLRPGSIKQEEEINSPKSDTGSTSISEKVEVKKEEEIVTPMEIEVKQEEEKGSDNIDEEEDSSEYAESDDPDKVWCICQQPHDDRFMICCDRCGEWYHGDCVGITVAEGKKMEKCGEDYICVRCNDYDNNSKAERAKNRSLRQSRRDKIRSKQIAELLGKRQGSTGSSSGQSSSSGGIIKKERMTRTCGGPGCDKPTTVTSIYCSEACIKKHVEFSMKKLKVRGLSRSSGDFGKGSGGVTVLDTLTKKLLTGLSAPSEKALIPWLKSHPSYKVFVQSLKGATPNKKAPLVKKSHDDDNEVTTPTSSAPSETNTRKLAQKAFLHALQTRTKLLPEEERASEDTLSKLALDIETKLYNLYNQEVNQKYRIKCRSLLFNLKDTKNQGLFKKLLCEELSTRELVRMTPEQLASEELAQWRQKTIKKELEMITEVAKEALEMSSSSVVRKMTYKGEIEIERNTDLTLESPLKGGQSEVSSTTNEVKYTPSSTLPQSNTPTTVVVKEEPSSIISSLLNDTTDKHGTHVFDQNCSICTRAAASSTTNTVIKEEEEEDEEEEEEEEKSINRLTSNSSSYFSPDSHHDNTMEHIVTSPDSVSYSNSLSTSSTTSGGGSSSLLPLWRGHLTMHAMPTFSAVAYHISGRVQGLSDVFPETLLIVGRINPLQVWDYIDKLKCSTSKEVVVLRFERIENEESTYLEMMDYLIQKQRYGVIQNTANVKDMYIIPLLSNESIPPQLLPFDGPGLPFNRQDTFICVITRPKIVPVSNETPRKRRYSGRVRFMSSSPADGPPEKKLHSSSQHQVEVGLGGATPPVTPPPIKVSFYGDSRESFDKKPLVVPSASKPPPESNNESLCKVKGISHSGIKSILSTLSDDKLQELASAMSTIQPSTSSNTLSQEQTNSSQTTNIINNSQLTGNNNNSQTISSQISQNNSQSNDTTTNEQRISLDERLSALQASANSSDDIDKPERALQDKSIVSDPRLNTPSAPVSSTGESGGTSLGGEQPVGKDSSIEHSSSYSNEGRPTATSGRYTYTRYDEEGAAQHLRDAYHGSHPSYHDYRSHDDRSYREDYRHHDHYYEGRPHPHPYWREREQHPSYNRNIADPRYGGMDDRRGYDHHHRRDSNERSGGHFPYHHRSRTSRWSD